MITAVQAFEGGYCRHLLAMVDRRTYRIVRFHAVFLALHHEREGWVLIDTGYGERFRGATRRFPYRLYRWATPATPAGSTGDLLNRGGIDPNDVRHVIVTHFHADHVGGLSEFPSAQIHYHADALLSLQNLTPWRQVRAAFLPDLIPDWLPARACPLAADSFITTPDFPFASHDLFGDGSVQLVPVPGHAPGQLGVVFTSPTAKEFYVADAFWRDCQLTDTIEPLAIAMSLQWDPAAYRATIRNLRTLRQSRSYRITACHDEGTAALLNDRHPS